MDIKTSRLYNLLVPISQLIGAAVLVGGVVSAILAATSGYLYDLGIEELKSEFVTHEDLEFMKVQILRATGEDRIVRMKEGWSYVIEPVYHGDESIKVNLILERTRRGQKCVFLEGATVFEDENSVRAPGSRLEMIEQIHHGKPKRFRLAITPPMDLEDGRIGLEMSLKYNCPKPGENSTEVVTEYDTIGPLFYYQRGSEE